MRFKQWLTETNAIYDGTKPKKGCGFNWWGSVGDPAGTEISGKADTAATDPCGTERKHARKYQTRKCNKR